MHPCSATTNLEVKSFRPLEAPELFALAMALRTEVFVKEQGVPVEEEQDEYDDEATHWIVLCQGKPEAMATGRMLPYQEACQARPVAKIGRIAVKKACRNHRLGSFLMEVILQACQDEGFDQVILDSQTTAMAFYESFGFIKEGFEFLDAGIPHYRMRKIFTDP